MTNEESKTPGAPRKGTGDLNEAILSSLKPKAGKGTTKWLAALSQEVQEEVAQDAGTNTAATAAAQTDNTVIGWVDRLFDLFTQYEFQFSKAVTRSDMKATIERPTFSSGTGNRPPSFPGKKVFTFDGRIVMRSWTLVGAGNDQGIDWFLIPSDEFFKFKVNSSMFSPFSAMTADWNGGRMCWKTEREMIRHEQLPDLAKQLFACLVRAEKGEPVESITVYLSQSQAASPAAPGMHAGTSGAESFEQQFFSVMRDDAGQPPSLASHGNVFESDPAPTPGLAAQPAPATGATRQAAAEAEPAQAQPVNFAQAFNAMKQALEQELREAAQAGAKAFETQDLQMAEQAMKRTAMLKAFQEKVQALYLEWDVIQKQDR